MGIPHVFTSHPEVVWVGVPVTCFGSTWKKPLNLDSPCELDPTHMKQDGAHEPECKHLQKATYVQMRLL